MEHRINGVLAEAWHHAYLNALTKTKGKFPKSPSDMWKKPASPEEATANILAAAKARKAAQDRAAKSGKPPRERIIMREE